MKKIILTFIILFFVCPAVPLLPQDDPITLSSGVDKSRITIGDLITYTVTVTHDKEVLLALPGLGANLGGFEIRDYVEHKPVKKEGQIISRVDYTISTFLTGEFEIPPLTILYSLPGDTVQNTLSTEKIKIIVESVKSSEAGDILDIKSPVDIPRNWWLMLRWYILGAALVLFILLGIIWYRRRKQGKGLLPVREEQPRPAHEIAYEALDQLKNTTLLEKGEIKQYYIEISEIIRKYIEGRYFVIAMEMTTFEVLENLTRVEISEEEYDLFSVFLHKCDMVKFAKVIPPAKANLDIMEMAISIVDRTKVVFQQTEAPSEIEPDRIEDHSVEEAETTVMAGEQETNDVSEHERADV